MNMNEVLKEKFGIPSIEEYDNKFNDLKSQFIEMGQLKSDFDIEKFTVKKEGNFIAHNFHFLMRQYVLALHESKRMLIEHEEKLRTIDELKTLLDKRIKEDQTETTAKTEDGKYIDLEIKKLMNQIDLLEVTMTNKLCMVNKFEKCRVKLIEMNDGVAPTNKQYQDECPKYWEWFLKRKALWQSKARTSGISEGVWENIAYLEEPALINKDFQRKVLDDKSGGINMLEAEKEINTRMGYDDRVGFIEKEIKKIEDSNKEKT